jgi:hypothetical protein
MAEGRLASAYNMQNFACSHLIIKPKAQVTAHKGVLIMTFKGIIIVSETLLDRINVTDRAM